VNYFGKFDAKVFDALGHQPGDHVLSKTVHAAHVPSDAIVVPDAQLLFGAEFKRAGVDLVLSGNGREHVVHDYFKGEKHAPLASPDGAHLTADVVTALSGQVQYAQAAGVAGGGHIIGHVTKLVGNATAIRNGVSIILNNGDNVEKGDVVQSGSDSTLGITFIDGTVFGLSSNARMVLNEMVYDPNGSNNSSLLSLVAGTITFVAGETAKHGDMKVDTPVATMGIRGTAVLFAVHFKLPNGSFVPDDMNPPSDAVPEGEFQVLQEPDGTTGSYILFEKTTLTPLAVVDRAGQQINISNGLLSQTTTPLSQEIQKLITDVFSLKFTDSSNTKSIEHFTDTIVPNSLGPTKFALLSTLPPTGPLSNFQASPNGPAPSGPASTKGHIGEAPFFMPGGISSGSFSELASTTGSTTPDKVTGTFQFFDVNVHDLTTVSAEFASFTYTDAQGNDIKAKLNPLELADVKAVENGITVIQGGLDSVGNGTASWTYKIPDGAFDFLAAGEKLTLTFNAVVDNNFQPLDQTGQGTFTVTITGTNDVPVITSPQQNIALAIAGTGTQGGSLPAPSASTTGTLNFTDPDLTDTHSASASLVSALLNGKDIEGTTVGETVFNELKTALTATVSTATDSTGTGAGTVQWTLASLQVYLADFVPKGESLVLTYAVTVTDSQGATSTQDVVFTVTGNKPAGTAWVDTTPLTLTNGVALWSTATNWSSGLVPSAAHNDDVLIGTDQVLPGTPTFPVTVAADASANSLTMTDFSDFTLAPELDVNSGVKLTITGALSLNPIVTDPTIAPDIAANPESTIKNFGTINVGGVATLLKHSVLDNYGILTLAKGGVFGDQSSITNDGTIEIKSGTLDLEVGVTNFVTTTLGTIQVDGGVTLALSDGATITSGNLTFADSSGDLTVGTGGATLGGVAVSGGGEIDIGSTTATGVTLTLDDAASVTDGKLVFADGSDKLAIGAGGATLDGVAVSGGGEIDIAVGTTLTVKNTVTLDDVTISGGTIDDTGTLSVGTASKMENATVNGGGNLAATSDTLTLSGVTLDKVTLSGSFTNLDTLTIDTATLNSAIVSGGTVDDTGTLLVSADSTIENATVAGDITVDSGKTLTLDTVTLDGVTLSGGTDDATAVTVSANSTIKNATVTGDITVESGKTLTLDTVMLGGVTLSGGTDKVTAVTVSADSTIENATVSNGVITVDSGTTLTLDTVTLNGTSFADTTTGGTILVGSGTKLTFNGATIDGGTLNILGELDSTGTGFITGATIINQNLINIVSGILTIDPTPITNTGTIEVHTGTGLVLDDDAVTNSESGSNGTIQVDANANLTLEDSSITGGTLDNSGTIKLTGNSSIGGLSSFVNSGTLESDGTLTLADMTINNAGHTLKSANGGVIDLVNVTINGGTLGGKIETVAPNISSTLSGVSLAFGTLVTAVVGILELTGTTSFSQSEIDAGAGATVDLDNATLSGGTLGGIGTITTDSGNSDSVLNGVRIVSGTKVTASAGTLDLTGTITNHGEIDASTGQLRLENADIVGGTLGGGGIVATGGPNFLSVLDNVTIASSAKVTAVSGFLELTDTINNNGEIDAANGALELDNATLVGGTLGGDGLIFTVGNSNEFSGVAIAKGTTVGVSDGTTLELVSTITDSGNISLDALFNGTELQISGPVSLTGGGDVTMSDSSHNLIGSDGSAATLTNYDTISGAGTIGDAHLTLVNEGTIDATGSHALVIDTGVNSFIPAGIVGNLLVTNDLGGMLEASAGSTLLIEDNVANDGVIKADASSSHLTAAVVQINGNVTGSGSIEIFKDAQVEIGGSVSSGQTVTFEQSDGDGLLILENSHHFQGTIAGLTEASPESHENQVDLRDLVYLGPLLTRAHFSQSNDTVQVSNFFDSVSLKVSGNSSGSFEVSYDGHGGTLLSDPAASGTVTIDSNQTLEISAASSAKVDFTNTTGTTGALVLDDSKDFTGTISGFAGDGTVANSNLIDITDLNIADVATGKTTYSDHGNGTGTLTLYNASGQAIDSINFDGNYQLANFTIEDDGAGHTLIVDPPVNTNGQTPGNTTVASSSADAAANDGFAFNFGGHRHQTANDFHPEPETSQPGGPILTNLHTGSNGAPDQGHYVPLAADGHDQTGLAAFAKAHLNAHDFHFV
jgi:fibronectin-binding autotransporter adhesin